MKPLDEFYLHYVEGKPTVSPVGDIGIRDTYTRVTKMKNGCLHVAFTHQSVDRYWGIVHKKDVGKAYAMFKATKYLHYRNVVGGSGHNNSTYIYNKRMGRHK